jgi:hypothetical protein
MKNIIFYTLTLILLLTLTFSFCFIKKGNYIVDNLHQTVLAEDDEDEEDEEEEYEDEDEYEGYEEEYYYEEVPAEEEVLVPVPSVTYVWAYDTGFDVDTDKDGLVDAIDPNPTIHEKLLYTDSDNDSVPDALDKIPNEDDFLYQQDTDENNNGILDSYER